MDNDSILKLKMLGKGGQGLILLSKILGEIFNEQLDYNVSIKISYDSAVRRGEVDVDLIASDNRISNPIIDQADLTIFLRDSITLPDSKLYAVEKTTINNLPKTLNKNTLLIDFIKTAEKNSLQKELNMIILGWLLNKLDLGIEAEDINKFLPEINRKSNSEAVKVGFNL